MPDKLLWSWTLEDNKALAQARSYPDRTEAAVGVVALTISLILVFIILSPVITNVMLYPILIFVVYMFYLMLTKKMNSKPLDKEAYLKIYNDGVSVNLEGLYGFYNSDNINLETLRIKKIFHGNGMGVWMVKGLCFETINPRFMVKVPLNRLMNVSIIELENEIYNIKSANNALK